MSWPDLINGAFEFVGGGFVWMNVWQILKDRGHAGVYVPGVIVFTSWGVWNLYYYPSLGQWASFVGGLSIVVANAAWVTLMLMFGKKS